MKFTMKFGISLILASLCCVLLHSCEGINFSISTPYGDASGIGKAVTISPRPVIVPAK